MKHQQGFTLIELLIVVLIAAILATIAYPSYQNYIRQTRLASVRTQMLHNAQQLERYYTQKSTFVGFPTENLQQNQYFNISFSEGTDSMPDPSDSGYILKAVPIEKPMPMKLVPFITTTAVSSGQTVINKTAPVMKYQNRNKSKYKRPSEF